MSFSRTLSLKGPDPIRRRASSVQPSVQRRLNQDANISSMTPALRGAFSDPELLFREMDRLAETMPRRGQATE